MSKENKLVPKLRFPEFNDETEWNSMPLKEVCDINPSIKKLPKEFIYIDLESVEDGKLLKKKVIKLDEAPSRAQRYLKSGDIIYQMVRPYQKNNYFFQPIDNFDYVASTGYAQIRPFQSKMYIYQYLHSQKFVDKVLAKSTGSNYPAINSSDLANLLIALPSEKEQQKIADCLSSLDDLITIENEKLAVLKTHKKGLIQQLFPTGTNKLPKLRFNGFTGKWTHSKLAEHIDLISGFAFQSIFFAKRGRKLLTPKNFTKHGVANFNNDNSKYTTEKCEEKYICKKDDLLILLTDLTQSCELLGKPVMLKQQDGEVLLNQRVVKVIVKNSLSRSFLLQFLLTDVYHTRIKTTASGSTVRHSSNKIILDTMFYYPSNLEEQKKIADVLSSLDEQISDLNRKVEAIKNHKKGLMQQLFPNQN